jgi:proline utilization trans-activator
MKKVFESPREVVPLISSPKIRKVLHMSLEASQKILAILESLQDQGLLGKLNHLHIAEYS